MVPSQSCAKTNLYFLLVHLISLNPNYSACSMCVLDILSLYYLFGLVVIFDLCAAKKDATNGKGPGWERFDFDKDAPLDDEEIEGLLCYTSQ